MKLTIALMDKRPVQKKGTGTYAQLPEWENVEFERLSGEVEGGGAVLAAFLRGLADDIDPSVSRAEMGAVEVMEVSR
jgi:hypothetical protein